MACSDEKTLMVSAEETALVEFKVGVVRSMKQFNAGLVETFDNVEDFLSDLHKPE